MVGYADIDPFVPGGSGSFLSGEYFFKKLFARPDPAILDLYILLRLQTGKANQVTRQIHYTYRLTHIQNKNLSVFTHRPGLNHQRDRFGDCHKIPHHLRLGAGDRTAGRNLFLEKRKDTASPADHLAEP